MLQSRDSNMDQETIENYIKHLGKRDFDAAVSIILSRFFNLTAIDVDGKGDGRSDYRVFSDSQSSRTIAIQRTVQHAQWETKAFDDAKKAVEELGARRYFFLTSRAHESTALLAVENRITAELKIPAKCLGATELAGIIVQYGLLREFAGAIGLPLDISIRDRPDCSEILLHAYIALGSDRSDLRQEVYDDTLLLALHLAQGDSDRHTLISNASDLLGESASVKERLSGRVDSLLSRGLIRKTTTGALALDEAKRLELTIADGVYQRELEQLASAQAQTLHDFCGLEWDAGQSATAATFLARWFIQRQLVAAEHASLPLTRMGLSRVLGDPEQELRNLLLSGGVPPAKLMAVIDEFVLLASEAPLVMKLTRAVTYVATEGSDLLRASRVLGAASWSQVIVTLDASVAIPYLCASLFCPTLGRFSRGCTECIRLLRQASANLVIPWVYINEVAAHLLKALDYPDVPEFEGALKHSHNGFVAHYYQLKASGQPAPGSLREFVVQFSRSVQRPRATRQDSIRAAMAEIQPLLAYYDVNFDDISRVPAHFRKDVETTYDFRMRDLGRTKSQTLVEHDVHVMSHARRAISEWQQVRMCLTWDAAMIAVGQELGDCGWIVSPHEASDIVQARVNLSGAKLTALAHSLARVRERPSEVAARIVDRVVHLASEHLQDWQFRERLKQFYQDAQKRVDLTSQSYVDIDREIDEFLQSEGVPIQADELELSD
jgi:hypothetical protein